MKRIAVYARVSTKDKKQTPETQLVAIRAYLSARRLDAEAPVAEFIDVGQSGSKDSRPALDEMLKAVREGTVSAVVVYRLDRLGRSLSHLLSLTNELKTFHTDFISVTEAIDTTTAQGELLFNLLGSLAQFERRLIIDRVRDGLVRARKQGTRSGKAIGRPRRIIDKERVHRMRKQGMSMRTIAAKLHTSLGKVHAIASA